MRTIISQLKGAEVVRIQIGSGHEPLKMHDISLWGEWLSPSHGRNTEQDSSARFVSFSFVLCFGVIGLAPAIHNSISEIIGKYKNTKTNR